MMQISLAIRNVVACLVWLLLPVLAFAGRYQPEQKWLDVVRTQQPFLPYRLGVVEFKQDVSKVWLEYLGDLRASLRMSNYFQQSNAPRLRIVIEQSYQSGSSNDDDCVESPGKLTLNYKFLDGDREVSRYNVITQAPVDGDNNNWDAAMAGNLKLLLLEIRKSQGDAQFVQESVGIEAGIIEGLSYGSNTSCTIGALLERSLVATFEGTVAVVEGLGQVAGVALEVAASPQFQNAMNSAMLEQQQQQAQQTASPSNFSTQPPVLSVSKPASVSAHSKPSLSSSKQNPSRSASTPAVETKADILGVTSSQLVTSLPSKNSPRSETEMAAANHSSTARIMDDRSNQPRRFPYPETIVVCTRPDSNGSFECNTPVDTNLRGGPKNGLAAWRTPESLVAWASASCPSPRRLSSITHLVWGCGFGATNNANSMDRSAGVDVKGRKTYYCSERQTSCRDTQP